MREQLLLYGVGVERPSPKTDTTSTFSDNLSMPIHRWFRFSAGFSAAWASEVMLREIANGRTKVFDPFAGSGTVLLEGERCGIESAGVEAHPFVARVARAKLHWRENPKAFRDYALAVLQYAKKHDGNCEGYSSLIGKCYPQDALSRLDSLKKAWSKIADGSANSELTWLALVSILRECSPVGTAQWQYVLPNKSKARAADPFKAFEAKVYLMSGDMAGRQREESGPAAMLHAGDARSCAPVPDKWADLVITSPPYTNNYDYADATRLEMSFLGEVEGWGDLQDAVRKYLVRSCTQHVAKLNGETFDILDQPLLAAIREEMVSVCKRLEAEREHHGGKKPYHTMIAAYFEDMARVWQSLRRVTAMGALVCFVVGDSAPYGVYVPVDKWLGELAVSAGFKSFAFEKTRDRNVKWKNRKHRVPLHEGRLWVQG
ncbi:MAG: DNA modification methylase [Verrucomicrobia bacterium]|nr:DNA modification methylase [Verrucomicrobiota bacterium]